MKVSKATAYALHAMMHMVRHRTQLPVAASSIAKAEGIPGAYLAKILQQLAKAGFLRSVRKHKRGYEFARPPETISLLELIEVMEGELELTDCLFNHCNCGGTPENCLIYAQWLEATKQMRKLLADTSIVASTWSHPEHRFDSAGTLDDAVR